MGCTVAMLKAYQQGDQEASTEVKALYSLDLYQLVFDLTADPIEADSIVNLVFQKATALSKHFKSPMDLETFLLNTTKNHAYDSLKSAASINRE